MLLVIDIGNTNIVVGCFEGSQLLHQFRLKTDTGRTVDEYEASLFTLLDRHLPPGWKFSKCIISSVVPPLTPDIERLVEERLKIKTLVVGPGIKTGISIRTADPTQVGSDRVINSLAARELFGAPSLVVDFGTATSFDYVNKAGEYEGGIIAPGLMIALDSLVKNTAKLPRIELAWPKTIVGKSTVAAMQSGALVGYVCMVDGLIDRIIAEVGKFENIIATGGLGAVVTSHSARISKYDPHLTLKGLQLVAALNE
ncbi:MAG: type III pantothenate kinase [Oligoflexia bacterium]|nr:type III pantothenate kinase [Oligoflexia bacterium]